ncbi:ribonuclease J [Chelatococcus sp. SYSU_G07232]|uniref:Ribonuclease J n=1 Tax=Chelatococcus albus TaxID=3047466 RepID=A0ABT7ADR7_9HYPH|nr:ribonuclease J [Chelatococcus sp. SYSU_G07232]MDJ1156761.1 ribonuclease J [Chelatococcus sp. SYSU_G07232]
MAPRTDSLVFVALGGLGEIGMNAGLYGFGPEGRRKWLLVDCGVSFAGEDLPGIDLVLPDIRFLEEERKNLVGIVITHAHEDHIGALAELWPRLEAPVYCTPFAAGLLELRRLSEPGAPRIPLNVVEQGGRIALPLFDVEFVPVSHSIPESNALAIRTPLGMVLHTGDWKIDPTPRVGLPTDEARFRALGDEGVLALVCDSTNVVRDGISPSEADVAVSLADIIKASPHRVAVTTFASNVARIRAVAEAAMACDREVVVVGRAMERVIDVATECGYLAGLPPFRAAETYGYLPRDKVVALLTGSQGEPRAALARAALDEHPDIALSPGDRVIFSSRTIPGNEKAVGRIINNLIRQGVEVITDRTHFVHVSGHPRTGELEQMYAWTRPRIAIPAHGEALHLDEHAKFARRQGVPSVVKAADGDLVEIAPGKPGIADDVPTGRLYKDGILLVGAGEKTVPERRRLSFAGVVSVAIAVDDKGNIAGDPEIALTGLPPRTRAGEAMDALVSDAVADVLDGLPKAKRRDPDAMAHAVERAVRAEVQHAWGKKPTCHVLVVAI